RRSLSASARCEPKIGRFVSFRGKGTAKLQRLEVAMKLTGQDTKKKVILDVARELEIDQFTPAEIEQIRRQLIVRLGDIGKTAPEYIVDILKGAGMRVSWSTAVEAEGLYEEEFHDLLHFATLEEAEMCLVRLDELLHKFRAEGQQTAEERVLEIARL